MQAPALSLDSSSCENEPVSNIFFANVTAMGDRAWTHYLDLSAKFDILGCAETHVGASQVRAWESKARQKKLRLIANAARPSGRGSQAQEDRANEGGEWVLARGHLHVEPIAEARMTGALKADGSDALDGFTASVLHFRGFSMVLPIVYCFSYWPRWQKYLKVAQDWRAVISLAAAVDMLG